MAVLAMSLRPELASFARIMEERLRANDHKGGWADCDNRWLTLRLVEEVGELAQKMAAWGDWYGRQEEMRQELEGECADVANFAMMIADNARNRRGM